MDDNRAHPNPQGLDELESVGLGQGRLIEAGDLFKIEIEKATGFTVVTSDYRDGKQLGVSLIDNKKHTAARFGFELFPGNHDIVVSTGSYVAEERRGVGLGWQMLKFRKAIAKKVGFQLMIATVNKDNEKEQLLLLKNGFLQGTRPEAITETAVMFFAKL